MNVVALIGVFVGLVGMMLIVKFGNQIGNRWFRYLVVIAGIALSIVAMSFTQVLIGGEDTESEAKSGEYLLYLGVAAVIIKSIFSTEKKEST